MAEISRRVVVLPRYTALAGPATGSTVFRSAPIQARDFSSVTLTTWVGADQNGTWSFKLERSQDLNVWREAGDVVANEQQEAITVLPLDTEWVRVKATLSADRFTCWMVADFTAREGT